MEKEAGVISGQEVTPLQDVLVIGEPTGILRFVVLVLPLKVGRTATGDRIATLRIRLVMFFVSLSPLFPPVAAANSAPVPPTSPPPPLPLPPIPPLFLFSHPPPQLYYLTFAIKSLIFFNLLLF